MKASDFDKAFDDGEDIEAHIDWASGRRPNLEPRRMEIDFPSWMVDGLDRQAETLGVKPQDLIKLWIAEKLS
ncbi:type II toxin-antitoxin system BrnA family antitoxin [Aureimonas leprariae]|uniref:CopG family transcriptional regulator n=1 Tax=Plantimonas leprariae TaxID=2615207 RepID=A0A7V7TWF3_9HYPH|nr:CopG family transcriptional regulator [Aureimonas leprariae]KAB0679770.1 CopG family transcriptional regulator [Aureimonas leprariae]